MFLSDSSHLSADGLVVISHTLRSRLDITPSIYICKVCDIQAITSVGVRQLSPVLLPVAFELLILMPVDGGIVHRQQG